MQLLCDGAHYFLLIPISVYKFRIAAKPTVINVKQSTGETPNIRVRRSSIALECRQFSAQVASLTEISNTQVTLPSNVNKIIQF